MICIYYSISINAIESSFFHYFLSDILLTSSWHIWIKMLPPVNEPVYSPTIKWPYSSNRKPRKLIHSSMDQSKKDRQWKKPMTLLPEILNTSPIPISYTRRSIIGIPQWLNPKLQYTCNIEIKQHHSSWCSGIILSQAICFITQSVFLKTKHSPHEKP